MARAFAHRTAVQILALSTLLLAVGCSGDGPAPQAVETEIPDDLADRLDTPQPTVAGELGTPLAERVATLGLLNKRNNLTQDLELRPGESRRVGNVVVKLESCERTAPWETPPETGAFVQVLVEERATPEESPEWRRIFSGWMFKNSPSLNVVEHPVYDVWVKDCAMSFPGEEPTSSAVANSDS